MSEVKPSIYYISAITSKCRIN